MEPEANSSSTGPSERAGEPSASWSPPVGQPVWVWCDGYRTMAILDAKGVWRNLADRKELKGVVKAIKPEE